MGDLIADGLERDVVVWIRDGIYYAPWGLAFGPEDSGTDSCSVTYASYPGEDASIVGGMVVTGWEAGADGQWKAPIPGGMETTQLFEDGRRMELARSPNYGYFLLPV